MKFGVALGGTNPKRWREITEEADRLGFESVWLPEHLVLPASMTGSPHHGQDSPPIRPDTPLFDVFVQLAHLSACTERIRLGTRVYNIGLRHPFVTARAAVTLDVVSQGRMEFGLGASWLSEEWDATGLEFSSRGRRVDECIEICRRLWGESVIEHHGEFFKFGPVRFEPKPVQPGGPPLLMGGDGPAAMRRAAKWGSGWIPMNHDLEDIPTAANELAEMCRAEGRTDRVEITMSGVLSSPEDVDRYASAGVCRVIVRPWKRSSEAVPQLRALADKIGVRVEE